MAKVVKLADLAKEVRKINVRSTWNKGIKSWALDLLEDVEDAGFTVFSSFKEFKETALNGAENWAQYCYGGCALIYDADIMKTFCTPSEIKRYTRKDGSLKDPNKNEIWMDIQARAAFQASIMINMAFISASRGSVL